MVRSVIPRLHLELLDDRVLPSVTVLDLTSRGAEVEAASGAIVQQGLLPADSDLARSQEGTTLDSFLRIDGRGIEQGYNSDNRRHQFDEDCGTHALTLGQVPVVYVDGVAYREFILTINEHRWGSRLSLDELRIYLGNSGYLSGYTPRTLELGGHNAVFDLDAGGNVSVLLRDRLTHCRRPDMTLLIPDAAFSGASPDTFVSLYSKFGGLRHASAGGGDEIWAVREVPPPLAAPTGGSISGFVQLYSSRDQDGEFMRGIGEATIRLQGVNELGEEVILETQTDANGAFTFTNLLAGRYTISEVQPTMPDSQQFYDDGFDMLGTIEGTSDSTLWGTYDPTNEIDMFMDIQLGTGQHGVNYTFTEIFPQ